MRGTAVSAVSSPAAAGGRYIPTSGTETGRYGPTEPDRYFLLYGRDGARTLHFDVRDGARTLLFLNPLGQALGDP